MLIFTVIGLALVFDFINGFHDAANSIATIVTTRVLTPFQAVLWAAAFNFLAFFVGINVQLSGNPCNLSHSSGVKRLIENPF